MTKLEKLLFLTQLFIYLLLAIFSFSYVDLNLTLSQNLIVLNFVSLMQILGYFKRPLATLIYLILIIILFSIFAFILYLVVKRKVAKKFLVISTIFTTSVLVFSYPFLSSDIFNYIFDAKIFLFYHQNPYELRALDFPDDPWIRFMRWTHRTTPYGFFWIGSSLIPAFLGFGKFTLNLLNFKLLAASSHLINTYLIFQILKKTSPKNSLLGTAFYALNPLVLIEGVANGHNDLFLMTFVLISFYFLLNRKLISSFIFGVLSFFIKYIPILFLPAYFAYLKTKNWRLFLYLSLLTFLLFTFLFSTFKISAPLVSEGATQTQFQPWYLLWTIPIVSLISNNYLFLIFGALSFASLLRYLPFLFFGDWSHPSTIPFMMLVTILPTTIVFLVLLFRNRLKIDSFFQK